MFNKRFLKIYCSSVHSFFLVSFTSMYTTLKIISRKFLGVSLILTFFSHVGAIFFLTAHTRDTCQKPGMDRNYSLIVFIVYMSSSDTYRKLQNVVYMKKKSMFKKKGGGSNQRHHIGSCLFLNSSLVSSNVP